MGSAAATFLGVHPTLRGVTLGRSPPQLFLLVLLARCCCRSPFCPSTQLSLQGLCQGLPAAHQGWRKGEEKTAAAESSV